ncbi:hypothetical protein VKT23_020422 [Stygiomarasmius scandens]|uniref:Uncharacterized protein n=1 Tax=Marasmiellus scandens TaxID=2682957 RepID=A0ABR1ILY0_9AGAR
MGTGRPRKYHTLEEQKAAKKRWNDKFYSNNRDKLKRQRDTKNITKKKKPPRPAETSVSRQLVQSTPAKTNKKRISESNSPLPPSSPPLPSSPLDAPSIKFPETTSRFTPPRFQRNRSKFVVCESDSEIPENNSESKKKQRQEEDDSDNDLPMASSVETSPIALRSPSLHPVGSVIYNALMDRRKNGRNGTTRIIRRDKA